MPAVRLLYRREDGRWAWRLTSDGQVIATDGTKATRTKAMLGKLQIESLGEHSRMPRRKSAVRNSHVWRLPSTHARKQ